MQPGPYPQQSPYPQGPYAPPGQYAPGTYAQQMPGSYAQPGQYAPGPYGYPGGQSQPSFGQSPATAAHWMLPTGRSWQSIAAGYVALVAIVLWPLGPVALALGIWALVRASRQGSHGRGRAIFAVVVGALITTLMIAIVTTL